MPHFYKPPGKNVLLKTADKLLFGKPHGFGLFAIVVIFVPESHLRIRHIQNAVIGDGYLVSITCQIFHHLRHVAHRLFGIYYPFLFVKAIFEFRPVGILRQRYLFGFHHHIQFFEKIALKNSFHNIVGEQIAVFYAFFEVVPAIVFVGPATAYNTMHMRMKA